MIAYPITDSDDFHVFLSEKTGMTIRTNYKDASRPVTHIGDMEKGLDLTAGDWLVANDNNIHIVDADIVRAAVIEYFEKHLINSKPDLIVD